jgi:inorganic triphosphatase YgiF
MGKEIELKLEVPPQELRRLKGWRALSREDPDEQDLPSVYFDTPKHKLGRNGISLRIRRNGKKRLQTIKSQGADGSFRRGEWENEIKGDVPDLRKVQGTALEPLLTKKLKHKLMAVFETRVRRTIRPVRRNGSRIEVALDEGEIRAGRRSTPISEVELELKGGDVGEVFELARELAKHFSIKLALTSKSQRGYDLLDNKGIEAARADKIELRHGLSPIGAFLVIGRSILRHIAANEPAVRRLDSEGIHQMRVGLRRLRGAMALFKNLLGDKQSERIKSELKWLTGELAPARDLDVYERSKIEPLRGVLPGKTAMKELAETLASRRAAAFNRAKAAVDSPRYRSLLLDTLQWLENGDWAKHRRRQSGPIERFATKVLASRTKKAKKKAGKLRQLDPRQRHKLRIAIKKLRYGSDFFENLFVGRKAGKRLSRFNGRLKDLQDCLGALNDISVHQKLASKIAIKRSHVRNRARAFAAGIITGSEQSEIKPLLATADEHATKFAHMRPYWT